MHAVHGHACPQQRMTPAGGAARRGGRGRCRWAWSWRLRSCWRGARACSTRPRPRQPLSRRSPLAAFRCCTACRRTGGRHTPPESSSLCSLQAATAMLSCSMVACLRGCVMPGLHVVTSILISVNDAHRVTLDAFDGSLCDSQLMRKCETWVLDIVRPSTAGRGMT